MYLLTMNNTASQARFVLLKHSPALHEKVQANENEYNKNDQVVHVLTPRRVQHISHLANCGAEEFSDRRKGITHGAQHIVLRVHLIIDVLA